jgi:hypothetical protein
MITFFLLVWAFGFIAVLAAGGMYNAIKGIDTNFDSKVTLFWSALLWPIMMIVFMFKEIKKDCCNKL